MLAILLGLLLFLCSGAAADCFLTIDRSLLGGLVNGNWQLFGTAGTDVGSIAITLTPSSGSTHTYTASQQSGSWSVNPNTGAPVSPGTYQLLVSASCTPSGAADAYTTVTVQCPSAPAFSSSAVNLGGTTYGQPGNMISGTGASGSAPCNVVSIVAQSTSGGSPQVIGTAISSSSGTWSAPIFTGGITMTGPYNVFPAVAYGNAWAIAGTASSFQSKCPVMSVTVVDQSTAYVEVSISPLNSYPGCSMYSVTFSGTHGNSYTTSATLSGQSYGSNTAYVTSAVALPNDQYIVTAQASDTGVSSNFASTSLTLDIDYCGPPTIVLASGATSLLGPTIPALQGTVTSTCTFLTLEYQIGSGPPVASGPGSSYTITGASGGVATYTYIPSSLPSGTNGPVTYTITSCGTSGSQYCTTSSTTFYYFDDACPSPILSSPVGASVDDTPVITGSYVEVAQYCDQLQLFYTDPNGNTFHQPVYTSNPGTSLSFDYLWSGTPLFLSGSYEFWVQLSSSYGRTGSVSGSYTAVVTGSQPVCAPPIINAKYDTVVIPLQPSLMLTGGYTLGCPTIVVYEKPLGQPAIPLGSVNGDAGYWTLILDTQDHDQGTFEYYAVSVVSGPPPNYEELTTPASDPVYVEFWKYTCLQPIIDSPAEDATISTTFTPSISGTMALNPDDIGDCTTLNVYFDGNSVPATGDPGFSSSSTVPDSEDFEFDPDTPLLAGIHSVYAEVVGSTGRPGFTYACTFLQTCSSPAAEFGQSFTIYGLPLVTSPPPGASLVSNSLIVTGTIPPGYSPLILLELTRSGGGRRRQGTGQYSGTTTAQPDNTYSYTFQNVPAGTYNLATTTTDSNNQPSTNNQAVSLTSPPVVSPPTRRKRSTCPFGLTACPINNRSRGFEVDCVPDVQTNLERCGACNGPDCTMIENADQVGCIAGECVVQSCLDGYFLVGNTCRDQSTEFW